MARRAEESFGGYLLGWLNQTSEKMFETTNAGGADQKCLWWLATSVACHRLRRLNQATEKMFKTQ
jgi:hypothetical protein